MFARALVVVVLVACGTDPPPVLPRTFGGDRPLELQVPDVLQANKKLPLVVILHDYGSTGVDTQTYFELMHLADGDVAFALAPEGTADSTAKQFWNADPACCDKDHKNPDDVGYLSDLIATVSKVWPIDPGAVAVLGHGNGGTMAYRLACEHADQVSNVIVLGAPRPSTTCAPTRPVNVLHIHGTSDDQVAYSVAGPSVQQWALNDHCGSSRTVGTPVDIEATIDGAETFTEATIGCPAGVSVDLWTIEGGGHVPTLVNSFALTLLQWIHDNRRP
jgi:polyhydroxybutyrate depolymerase